MLKETQVMTFAKTGAVMHKNKGIIKSNMVYQCQLK